MRLLPDTHVFLWYITADPKLQRRFGLPLRIPVTRFF